MGHEHIALAAEVVADDVAGVRAAAGAGVCSYTSRGVHDPRLASLWSLVGGEQSVQSLSRSRTRGEQIQAPFSVRDICECLRGDRTDRCSRKSHHGSDA